jgi:hypothetical protein
MHGQSATARNNIALIPVSEHAVLQGGMAPLGGSNPFQVENPVKVFAGVR